MRTWLAIAIGLATASPALAQDTVAPELGAGQAAEVEAPSGIFEHLGLTGTFRAGYWSSTRELDSERHLGAGMLWLKTSRRLSSHVSVLAEGWTALRGPLDNGEAGSELREGFVDLRFGQLDVRAGRQIIAWGRADGINPTDNLSGQDLTLLVPDDADRRLGTTAVRASYYLGDVSFTGIWLPEFRGHQFALPAPPPGVAFAHDNGRWPGDQWALRVEQTGRTVDWSVSYFDGKDTTPDLGLAAAANGGPGIVLSHHRVRVFGADMAANLGRFGIRAEGAYVQTEDDGGRDPFTKNPYVFAVAGADRTLGGELNLNVQYVFRYVLDDIGVTGDDFIRALATQEAVLTNQTRHVQHGISFRLANRWLHDTLEAECAGVVFAGPSGRAVRPKVAYSITDDWKVLAGVEILQGETSSLFGLLHRNSTAYLELRLGF
jgi:hypothetical protein